MNDLPVIGSSIGSNSPSAHESLFQLALFVELFRWCWGDFNCGGLTLLQLRNADVCDVIALFSDDKFVDKLFGRKLLDKEAVVDVVDICCFEGDVLCELSFAKGSISSFNWCCCNFCWCGLKGDCRNCCSCCCSCSCASSSP